MKRLAALQSGTPVNADAPPSAQSAFEDPGGIGLLVVAMRKLRQLVKDHWHELTELQDPLTKTGLPK
jgi:hypothetical protein